MKATALFLCTLWLGGLLVGCKGDDREKNSSGADSMSSDARQGDTKDTPPADTDDVEAGAQGESCTSDAACVSGTCVPSEAGWVCAGECTDDCTESGWVCRVFGTEPPELLCVPPFGTLCRPCLQDSECGIPGSDDPALCVDMGDSGRFCGGGCSEEQACPEGYTCTETPLATGGSTQQCWPTNGLCECSALAISEGAKTLCYSSSSLGTCLGERQCGSDGLSECSAAPAAFEVCDDADNDCDGETDEGTSALPCGAGDPAYPCGGQTQCTEGVESCVPFAPEDEICDGLDNDCDGETDETFPELGQACDGPDPDICANGVWACTADAQSVECVKEGGGEEAEVCDGLDNDCNGETDETFLGLGQACDGSDADLCKNGVFACTANGETTECVETGEAKIEVCDSTDNDCDGATDEDYPTLGAACDGSDADQCAMGVNACTADGSGVACVETGMEQVEVCDGVDNDCDSSTDEGLDCPTVTAVVALDGLSGGLYRSENAGQNWTLLSIAPIHHPAQVSLTRTSTQTLYLGTYFSQSFVTEQGYPDSYVGPHVVRSDDGGSTWTQKGGWSEGNSVAVCAHPTTDIVYGIASNSNKVWRSQNEGNSFELASTWGGTGAGLDCTVTSVGTVVLADSSACAAGQGCSAIWVSNDGGDTFEPATAVSDQGLGATATITSSPGGRLFALDGTKGVFRSDNTGQSWALAGTVEPALKDVADLVALSNDLVYATTVTSACAGDCDPATSDAEYFVSENGGETWEKVPGTWLSGGNGGGWAALETVEVLAN